MDDDVKLMDIIKSGAAIKTKHCHSTFWVNNVVLNVNEKFIEIDIGLDSQYLKTIVMVGDTIQCKYNVDEGEYVFLGWITNIDLESPQRISIRIHDVDFYKNAREYFRYNVYVASVIKQNLNDKSGIFAVMINISSGGAAFLIKKDILEELFKLRIDDNRENFIFEIYISKDQVFRFKGKILRKTPRDKDIEIGVKLLYIDKENNVILESFIKELENENKEDYNKKSSFWTKNSKFYKGE